jgi:endogenous inhibitor of DNA gyrase (YacG/DUF329 family)
VGNGGAANDHRVDLSALAMLGPTTCPTCQKVHLASINARSNYCSMECQLLDPRHGQPGNGAVARYRREVPLPTAGEKSLYHRDVGAPEPDWLKAALAPPRLSWE